MTRRTLRGSLLPDVPPSGSMGLADTHEASAEREVTLYLRPSPGNRTRLRHALEQVQRKPLSAPRLGSAELARLVAASEEDLHQVRKAVGRFEGISIVDDAPADTPRHRIVLRGTAQSFARLFGVGMSTDVAGPRYKGELSLPAGAAECVQMVAGLRYLPNHLGMRQQGNRPSGLAARDAGPKPSSTEPVVRAPYEPQQVAHLYGFPPDYQGAGQRIAVFEQPGGFLAKDMKAYFQSLHLPEPHIQILGRNQPAPLKSVQLAMRWLFGPTRLEPPNQEALSAAGTFEVTQNLQTIGALVPQAHIQAHFARSGSLQSFLELLWNVLLSEEKETPSVVTGSFGFLESKLNEMEALFLEWTLSLFALRGITLVFPTGNSGPYGSVQGPTEPETPPHLDVLAPASSPHVLAVGGTRFWSDENAIVAEVMFADVLAPPFNALSSGGGFSSHYALPAWQSKAVKRWRARAHGAKGLSTGRGVPDLSVSAHIFSGWRLHVGGLDVVTSGTSAAAPLVASFILRVNELLERQGLRPLGYFTPLLYEPDIAGTFFDIVRGNSDFLTNRPCFNALLGWDVASGLGALRGQALVEALLGRLMEG